MFRKVEQLTRLYERFNARDLDAVLATVHRNVIWANGMQGGYVRGHNAVRDYWKRQWTIIDPHVEPVEFKCGTDEEVVVVVHQVVRDLRGALLTDKVVGHIFWIVDGLVRRFDIRNP